MASSLARMTASWATRRSAGVVRECLLRVESGGLISILPMAVYGASRPLPRVLTKVRLLNRLPTLDLGGGTSCPIADLRLGAVTVPEQEPHRCRADHWKK